MKRVKAQGGRSYKFVSPARRNVPDTIDLHGFKIATQLVQDVVFRESGKLVPLDECLLIAKEIVASAFGFTECKAPDKKPRGGQQREIARIRKLGYRVDVVDR